MTFINRLRNSLTSAPLAPMVLASSVAALALTACATAQENPNYQHSTRYQGSSPYTVTGQATTTPASYQTRSSPIVYDSPAGYSSVTQQPVYQANSQYSTPSYTQVNHDCLSKEMNRQLIGGAVGGAAGAFAGKELIGGTKGTVAGALVGGVAGYGIGDKSINCDPVPVVAQPTQMIASPTYYPTTQPYQPAQVVPSTPYTTAETMPYVVQPSPPATPTDTYYGDTVGTPGYEAIRQSQIETATPSVATTTYQPATGTVTAAMSQEQYANPIQGGYGILHTVVQNDTVYSLSRKLCSSVDEIQAMNGIDSNYSIKIGQNLKLPSSKC